MVQVKNNPATAQSTRQHVENVAGRLKEGVSFEVKIEDINALKRLRDRNQAVFDNGITWRRDLLDHELRLGFNREHGQAQWMLDNSYSRWDKDTRNALADSIALLKAHGSLDIITSISAEIDHQQESLLPNKPVEAKDVLGPTVVSKPATPSFLPQAVLDAIAKGGKDQFPIHQEDATNVVDTKKNAKEEAAPPKEDSPVSLIQVGSLQEGHNNSTSEKPLGLVDDLVISKNNDTNKPIFESPEPEKVSPPRPVIDQIANSEELLKKNSGARQAKNKSAGRNTSEDDQAVLADEVGLPTLHSVIDIGDFKGAVTGLISAQAKDKCVVLDMGCAEVAIVCTKEFYGTGSHTALLSTISGRRYLFKIIFEYFADAELIEHINKICTQRAFSNKGTEIINEVNRFIVLYDDIVRRAVELKTTDIHFEISDDYQSLIRLRIYGRLRNWKTFPTELVQGALTAAYSKRTKSGTNSGAALTLERAVNTITQQTLFGKQFNGRFSGYPVVNGYDVVMRLLENDPNGKIPTIESLGYSEHHVTHEIMPAIARNEGIILIAGSTGSGKSTAIRSFIYCLPKRQELKIYGVEDPVEYVNFFMRQISIQRNTDDPDEAVKMKFLSALRSLVRMDPDAIMLGEIRDKDSAEIAAEFAETGHRAFSTAHGNGAVDVLKRLTGRKIGLDPETLGATNFLSAVMYQKLLPKLCPHCKIPALKVLPQATVDTLRNKFSVDPSTMFCANEAGCEHCIVKEVGIAGTKGLTVVAEILIPSPAIQEAIQVKDWATVEDLWRGQRRSAFDDPDTLGKTAFEHALYKACAGIIDPQDIEADFTSFSAYRKRDITGQSYAQ